MLRIPFFAAVAAVTFGLAVIGAEPSGLPDSPPPRLATGSSTAADSLGGNSKPAERLREGTRLVDVVGTFQTTGGDSISFFREGSKDSYRVLENLALQRVGQVLEENRGTRQWVVSGTITEYRSANYLLVSKAVVQLQEGEIAAGQ